MTEYDEEAFLGEIPKTVLFLIICIATSVGALSFCSRAVTAAFLFFFSFIVGRAAIGCFDAETIEHAFKSYTWISKGPEELLFALLPTLVFETAYGFEIQDFRRYKWQSFLVGGVCYYFIAGLVATMACAQTFAISKIIPDSKSWPVETCWSYASIVSATDPLTSSTMLHHVGIPHHLVVLMRGESITSDGLAMFMYHVVKAVSSATGKGVILKLAFLGVGLIVTILIGYVCGRVAAFVLRGLYIDVTRENAVLLVFVYGCYALCKFFNGSGILGLFVFALTMNVFRRWMNREQFEANSRMWTSLAFYADCIITIVTGLSSSLYMRSYYLLHAALAYLVLLFSRACVLVIATPLLRKLNGGRFPIQYTGLLIWGGVRGGLSVLLAWRVYRESQRFGMRDEMTDEEITADLLRWMVGASVTCGHLVQGVTIACFGKLLGLGAVSVADMDRLKDFSVRLNGRVREKMAVRKSLPRYAEADWSKIERSAVLQVPDEHLFNVDTIAVESASSEEEEHEYQVREIIQRLYDVELWKMAHFGSLSLAPRHVQHAIDDAVGRRAQIDVDRLISQHQPLSIWRSFSPCGGWSPDCLNTLVGHRRSAWWDCWRFLCCVTAAMQVSTILVGFLHYGKNVLGVVLFLSGVFSLFNFAELVMRLWVQRKLFRSVYFQKKSVLDWLFLLSMPFDLVVTCLHFYIYNMCDRDGRIFKFGDRFCPAWIRLLLIGLSSICWLKTPLGVLLLIRILTFECGRRWQLGDEAIFEMLQALITISSRIVDELNTGELATVEPSELRHRLVLENQNLRRQTEQKTEEFYSRPNGKAILASIKTRRAAFDLLYDTVQFFNAAKQLGELNETEYKMAISAVERLRSKAVQWSVEKCMRKSSFDSMK